MKKTQIITLFIIALSFLAGFYLYPKMPEQMASHWSTKGEVDDYMSRFWGLFLMPIASLGIFLLFLLIPKIDPLKANIEKFRKYYEGFIFVLILFLFYVYGLTIVWNLGARFDMAQVLAPAFGGLFYYVGVLLENAKRNWFVGIRTPWTLSSERVWKKTHQVGAKLFKIVGLIALLGLFFPSRAIILMVVPAIVVAFYTLIYSYFEYSKYG